MIEANKYKLGIFVVTGFFLFLLCLFMLGLSEVFKEKATLVTLFQESVQGLDIGSPVKYKGVPIGKVKRISIRTDDKLIKVDMEIRLSGFDVAKNGTPDDDDYFYEFMKKEIAEGLRCQLNYAGITGMKYVEIDYLHKSSLDMEPPPGLVEAKGLYIPAAPSIFKDMLNLINTSLEKIAKVPFDKISTELSDTFISARKLLQDPKVSNMISKLEEASDQLESSISSVNKVLTEQKIKSILSEVQDGLVSINNLAGVTTKAIQDARLPETSRSFRDASYSVVNTKDALANTLTKLNQALDSITELANSLSDDPSSIIRGKQTENMIPKIP
ncbi:MAG: hypothetical protein A2020_15205 [Lentisphaerae bacterium GWF2_45_14]|nr:MAG: hypothetical protein A2020_15205 [Lentisphaerae bacterium GWF2_45_14]